MFWWRPGLAPRNRRWARLAGSLMELGHWSHLPPERAREEMRAVARGEYPFAGPAFEGLEFFADGEDLAEGGVEEMLGEMEPALRRHGVQLRVETVRRSGLVDACNLPELPVDAPPGRSDGAGGPDDGAGRGVAPLGLDHSPLRGLPLPDPAGGVDRVDHQAGHPAVRGWSGAPVASAASLKMDVHSVFWGHGRQ